jgi:hypothetical protein
LGERRRYDKDGNPLTEKEAHRGNKRIEQVVTVVTVGYLIYRATRLVPSVAVPALWPTVPLNLAVP